MGTTVIFSLFSFIGTWYLYRSIIYFEPVLYKYIGYAVFYMPSVVFWGGGIMKDTVCISALGLVLFCLVNAVVQYKLQYLFLGIFFGWVILSLKAYIIVCLAATSLLFIYWEKKEKIKNIIVKVVAAPIMLIMIIGIGYYFVPMLLDSTSKYKTDDLNKRVEGFQSWHTTLAQRGGSGYSLGHVELTPVGMFKKFPAAVNVSLFRPYLWEVKNVVNLIAGFESALFMWFTLYLLFTKRFMLLKLLNVPHLKFFLMFSVIFAFIVGFTSYNFGALVRFKIPLLPFYATVLISVYYRDKFSVKGINN